MKSFLKDNKGATVMELIIYIVIVSFILIDISGILSQIVFNQTRIQAITREDENARTIMRLVSESVEEANVINAPYGANATASTLNLTDNQSNIIIYSLQNGIVYKQVNSNAAVAISSSDLYVKDMIFTVESQGGIAPSMNIQLDIQQNSSNSSDLTHYETTAAQRIF